MAYSKPELRKRIVASVKAGSQGGKAGQWSARKAQLANQRYEKAGGGYSGPKTEAQKKLSKWTKEDWRTKSGKPSTQGKTSYRKNGISQPKQSNHSVPRNMRQQAALKGLESSVDNSSYPTLQPPAKQVRRHERQNDGIKTRPQTKKSRSHRLQ